MLTRRNFVSAAAAAVALPAFARQTVAQPPAAGPFTLGKLPYDYTALEPVIDAETMTIHHTKHHQAYVDNLNKAVAGTEWAKKSIVDLVANLKIIPEAIRPAVQNNGGGHWNHTFFWSVMAKPGTGGEAKGDLLTAIDASFGSLDGMKKAVLEAATKRLVSTPNQDSPVMTGAMPILGVDVWEHAYYLKYKNLRAKYVEEWFKVVNWDKVAGYLQVAGKL